MNAEDFVTYEQGLALKKLGFREKCLYHYNILNEFVPNNFNAEDETVTVDDLYDSLNTNTLSNIVCDIPTLAQVQKWLRKEKNLYVYADGAVFDKNYEKPSYYPCILDVISEHDKIGISDFNHYLTPEEALSAGITECIKILKEN